MLKLLISTQLICLTLLATSQTGIVWGPEGDVNFTDNNEQPRIVIDGNNNPMVLWGNSGNVMFSKWNGTAFNSPLALNPGGVVAATASWQGPDIASQGDTVYVVYKETPENLSTSPIQILSSFDAGDSWNSPVQVDNIPDSLSRFPTVAINSAGHPYVAYMKFDPGFLDPRWVVVKSNDYGATFGTDVLASGWSSPTAEVCDCCPAKLVISDDYVAMLYRDNDSDIRDTWVGVSTDDANSFTFGLNLDQLNWNINSCPSSGPDGFIIDDNLYSTSMNGGFSSPYAYYGNADLNAMTSGVGSLLSTNILGISNENFPRTDNNGLAAAYVWKQVDGGNAACVRFSNDIVSDFPQEYDTVATDFVINADVVVSSDKVWVVWEDIASNTVKYRCGTYTPAGLSIEKQEGSVVEIYPNPSTNEWNVDLSQFSDLVQIELLGQDGKRIMLRNEQSKLIKIESVNLPNGIYFLNISNENVFEQFKLVKI